MNDREEERLARRVAEAYRRPAPLGPEARERLDRVLATLPPPARRRLRPFAWLIEPWTVRLRPLAIAATLLVVLAAGVLAGRMMMAPAGEGPPTSPAIVPAVPGDRIVEFVLVAPRASSVALVGDFNAWDSAAAPMRRAHDGDTWTVTVPVSEGPHAYAFVVDGTRWVADPLAPLAPGDAFGSPSSILVVAGRSDT
jgi:predicted carbohydrate-binding protein with CBM48